MLYKSIFILGFIMVFWSCDSNENQVGEDKSNTNERKEKTIDTNNSKGLEYEKLGVSKDSFWSLSKEKKFVYNNIDTFVLIGSIANLHFLNEDSIPKYIQGYNHFGELYLYSYEGILNELRLFTIVKNHGVCDKRITLVISNKNTGELISQLDLSEQSGCESPKLSYSIRLDKKTIRRYTYPDISSEQLNGDGDNGGIKYKKIIESFTIQSNGKIRSDNKSIEYVESYRDVVYK